MTHCIHSNGESNTIKLSHANEHIRRYDYRINVTNHIIYNGFTENFSIFKNRISYNTTNDSYYENGITKNKYLEFWDKGALEYDNIIYVPAYGHNRVFLSSFNSNKLGYIIWKFDYNDPYKQQQSFL
ncbi:hypothetical protein RhiirB3_419279 [Rhizophagus irregularis]|nr:hypothetical protein RhiirB3_419279 [Rhizophagus irregularis]